MPAPAAFVGNLPSFGVKYQVCLVFLSRLAVLPVWESVSEVLNASLTQNPDAV